MAKPEHWEAFCKHLMEVYWVALPPAHRLDARVDAPDGDPEVPQDIWRAALMIFPDVEAWLSNPIPNLGRRTPLQVLKAGEADTLRAILIEVAGIMLPPAEEMAPWPEEEE